MESGFEKLVKAFSQNNQVFRNAFQLVDGHILCMRRVMNDVACDALVLTDWGTPDWEWYYEQYRQVLEFEQFVAWFKTAFPDLPAPVEQPSSTVEFGGDYVNG